MKFYYNKKFLLFTFISLLLIGQSGLLVHATEHPFHHADESCQIYILLEQSDDALLDCPVTISSNYNFQTINYFNSPSLYLFQTNYSIRAPPFQTAS